MPNDLISPRLAPEPGLICKTTKPASQRATEQRLNARVDAETGDRLRLDVAVRTATGQHHTAPGARPAVQPGAHRTARHDTPLAVDQTRSHRVTAERRVSTPDQVLRR